MNVSLKNRIITMMIVFTAVLIGAFTLIQLQNQLRTITIFNSLKAKLTVRILRNALQEALREAGPETEAQEAMRPALESLKEAGLLKNVFVYSKSGLIKASTEALAVGSMASPEDAPRIKAVFKNAAAAGAGSFHPYVNKQARILHLYMPAPGKEKDRYAVRLDISLGNINEALRQVYVPGALTACVVVLASIIFGIAISRRVVGPIALLNTATKEVAAGDLNLRIHMNTKDELEELANTFNEMAIELKKMRVRAENANPLTKLPGNVVIQEIVKNRIVNKIPFMVIYCDLDNFKAFNDNYGIKAGDEAIKLTASIFKEAIDKKGTQEDFIGHEGGDDFILVTRPERANALCEYITTEFDKHIRSLYNKKDLERGYIEARARAGNEIFKFPIMTISLAGVTNRTRPIRSYAEVTNIAAEVKKKAKKCTTSCFVVDKRGIA